MDAALWGGESEGNPAGKSKLRGQAEAEVVLSAHDEALAHIIPCRAYLSVTLICSREILCILHTHITLTASIDRPPRK